jgi:hypothetical protein
MLADGAGRFDASDLSPRGLTASGSRMCIRWRRQPAASATSVPSATGGCGGRVLRWGRVRSTPSPDRTAGQLSEGWERPGAEQGHEHDSLCLVVAVDGAVVASSWPTRGSQQPAPLVFQSAAMSQVLSRCQRVTHAAMGFFFTADLLAGSLSASRTTWGRAGVHLGPSAVAVPGIRAVRSSIAGGSGEG